MMRIPCALREPETLSRREMAQTGDGGRMLAFMVLREFGEKIQRAGGNFSAVFRGIVPGSRRGVKTPRNPGREDGKL